MQLYKKMHSNTHTFTEREQIITLKLLHERSCDANRQLIISVAELLVCVRPEV